jgi:hypothetical protein
LADKTQSNQAILSLAVQGKNIYVMSEDDPNNRDPIAKRKLAALYGEGNIVVLPRSQFLRYLGGEDIISILASEFKDPLSNYSEGGDTGVENTGLITLPPPINAKFVKVSNRDDNGKVTVTFSVEGIKTIKGNPVTYHAKIIDAPQKPKSRITQITSVAAYPLVNISFDTVADADRYLVKLISNTDSSGKTFSAKVHTPFEGQSRTTYVFTNVPRGTYKISVTPYNSSGISGVQIYQGNTGVVDSLSQAKVVTV